MADVFFALSPADRRDALEVAAARSGRAVHLLEKDVWVVWTLNALFSDNQRTCSGAVGVVVPTRLPTL